MAFANKIALAIDLAEPLTEIFKGVRELNLLAHEIHLLSINQTTTYAIGFGEAAIIYPMEDDQKKIRDASLVKLKEISQYVLPKTFGGKVFYECLFANDIKRKFCDYVADNNIDTVIMAAREKRGIFEGSFTQYVTKHTKANIILLKHAL